MNLLNFFKPLDEPIYEPLDEPLLCTSYASLNEPLSISSKTFLTSSIFWRTTFKPLDEPLDERLLDLFKPPDEPLCEPHFEPLYEPL